MSPVSAFAQRASASALARPNTPMYRVTGSPALIPIRISIGVRCCKKATDRNDFRIAMLHSRAPTTEGKQPTIGFVASFTTRPPRAWSALRANCSGRTKSCIAEFRLTEAWPGESSIDTHTIVLRAISSQGSPGAGYWTGPRKLSTERQSTSMIWLGTPPCASRCVALAASLLGESIKQKPADVPWCHQ